MIRHMCTLDEELATYSPESLGFERFNIPEGFVRYVVVRILVLYLRLSSNRLRAMGGHRSCAPTEVDGKSCMTTLRAGALQHICAPKRIHGVPPTFNDEDKITAIMIILKLR